MLTVMKMTVCSSLMTNSRRQRSSIGIFPIFFPALPDLFAFEVVYLGVRGCGEDHCICKYSVILFPMHLFFVPSPWRFVLFCLNSWCFFFVFFGVRFFYGSSNKIKPITRYTSKMTCLFVCVLFFLMFHVRWLRGYHRISIGITQRKYYIIGIAFVYKK